LGFHVTNPETSPVTVLLKAWGEGDSGALDRLTPIVYDELRRIARRYMMSERLGNTLQPTALVNEVYLRLVDVKNVDWQHRAQFFAISAQIMRRILVDSARARGAEKRGGGAQKVNFDEIAILAPVPEGWIVELDAALQEFEKLSPRQAKVVELRYFGGLSIEEIATLMKTSSRTIERDWQFSRSWLMMALSPQQ
jgi:RNA polymerase sigma factor (TIGR02999 family)